MIFQLYLTQYGICTHSLKPIWQHSSAHKMLKHFAEVFPGSWLLGSGPLGDYGHVIAFRGLDTLHYIFLQ